MTRLHVLCVVFTIAAACGASDDGTIDISHRDPRCVAACPETMAQYADIGPVCDTASRVQCLDQCAARIAGLRTVCQSCLLENAHLDPSDSGGQDVACDQNTCTVTTELGMCSYPESDHAAYLDCLRRVDPHRTVSCTASFQSTMKCASVCS